MTARYGTGAGAEIVSYERTSTLPAATSEATRRLRDFAEEADAAHSIALVLVQTSFVPKQFRNQASEATAAILAGNEVGLSPLAALRSFDIIEGVAAPRALTLRAVALAAGHEVEVVESTNTRCKVRARRRGSTDWQTVLWTIERANSLGLPNRGATEEKRARNAWRTQPQNMLVARATAEAARLVAADAILGLNGGYSIEEVRDADAMVDVTAAVVDVETGEVARRRRRRPIRDVELPPMDDPPLDAVVEGETVESADEAPADSDEPTPPDSHDEPITDAQIKNVGRLFTKIGLGGRDNRSEALAWTETVIGRHIESRKELTKTEAIELIDALMHKAGEKPPPPDEPPLEDYDPRDEG